MIVAFVLRLAAGWAWQSRLAGQPDRLATCPTTRFGMGDSEATGHLHGHRRRESPIEYGSADARVFRTPGYPLLLAPIVRLADGGHSAVLLAQAEAALLGTLAVLGVWWLTRLLFDDRTAFLAAGLATFYPGAIALSALVLSEAPFCPLMLLELGVVDPGVASAVVGGRKALGFCAGWPRGQPRLMRPSWLLFTPFATAVGMLAAVGQTFLSAAKASVERQTGMSAPRDGWRSATLFRHERSRSG